MNSKIPLIALIFLLIISCTEKKVSEEYYVISEHEYKPGPYNDSIPPPPPPPPHPANMAWYSNLVLIFDTLDWVYLYQTECTILKEFNWMQLNFEKAEYPVFIGLTPDHIVKMHASYIKDFLLSNSNYFMLDSNITESVRVLYMVSVSDTIKNPAFYEIRNMIKMDRRKHGAIISLIRKTTEEENAVLNYIKSNKIYNAKEINWSLNFIDGQTKPFTSRYDSIERKSSFVIKAKESFMPAMTRIAIYE